MLYRLNRLSFLLILEIDLFFSAQIKGNQLVMKIEKKWHPYQYGKSPDTSTIPTSYNCSLIETCSCKRLAAGGMKALCAGLELTSIPDFSDDVIEIDLSQNYIQYFPNNSKFPEKLVSLDLSNNLFHSLDNDPFQSLSQLLKLDLSGNKLDYVPKIFRPGIFRDLTNLIILNLKGNNGVTKEQNYPEEIATIKTLRELHVDGLKEGKFSHSFSGLSFLSTLNFSGHAFDNCRITQIKENFLPIMPSIKILSFSTCDLMNIERGSLRHLSNLTTLDISNNNYLSYRVLRNLTFDLQFTKIKHLNLTFLHCPAGVGSMIMPSDIEYLSNTSLEELYLPFNRLELVGNGVVKLLPKSLHTIDASGNNMIFFPLTEVLEMFRMPKLEKIQLCCQTRHRHRTRVGNSVNCHDWRGPYIHQTDYKSMLRTDMKMKQDVGAIITAFQSDKTTSNKAIVRLTVSETIKFIDLHLMGIYFDEHSNDLEIHVSEPNNIRRIDLADNLLYAWNFVLKNVSKLEHLSLANNHCFKLLSNVFYDLPSLRYLNIENNVLGEVFSRDIEGKYFQYLNNLTHLRMKNNGISYIPDRFFHGLPNLKVLTVNVNTLSEWNVDIGHMLKLEFLNLSTNRIQAINKKSRDAIDNISKTSKIKIDLHDNPLQCNCDTLEFLNWINKRKTIFIDFQSYTCVYNNIYISMINLTSVITKLESNCSSYTELVIVVLACISFVIFLICGAIIYRYRWKLRYLYFMAKQGNRPITDNLQFEFDAFISYANQDGNFVETELLQKMEEHYGLKLRLHRRDFLPGNPIAENITDNIHRSHKTVAILSNNYLNSYWCKFEFNMARMESVYSRGGEPTLFIVLLEDLKPRDLPLMMMDVIDSDSYIKVPELRNDEFWENFYKGIWVL